MNYEVRSKSRELARTLTPNILWNRDYCGTEEKIFEQKETKVTK
jgi:hypothetical protein